MATEINLLSAGVGSVKSVTDYLQAAEGLPDEGNTMIYRTSDLMQAMLELPAMRPSLFALCAAVLNTQFDTRGRLYKVDGDGNPDWDYIRDPLTIALYKQALKA